MNSGRVTTRDQRRRAPTALPTSTDWCVGTLQPKLLRTLAVTVTAVRITVSAKRLRLRCLLLEAQLLRLRRCPRRRQPPPKRLIIIIIISSSISSNNSSSSNNNSSNFPVMYSTCLKECRRYRIRAHRGRAAQVLLRHCPACERNRSSFKTVRKHRLS